TVLVGVESRFERRVLTTAGDLVGFDPVGRDRLERLALAGLAHVGLGADFLGLRMELRDRLLPRRRRETAPAGSRAHDRSRSAHGAPSYRARSRRGRRSCRARGAPAGTRSCRAAAASAPATRATWRPTGCAERACRSCRARPGG